VLEAEIATERRKLSAAECAAAGRRLFWHPESASLFEETDPRALAVYAQGHADPLLEDVTGMPEFEARFRAQVAKNEATRVRVRASPELYSALAGSAARLVQLTAGLAAIVQNDQGVTKDELRQWNLLYAETLEEAGAFAETVATLRVRVMKHIARCAGADGAG
jgi:hypothetical protein